MKDKVLSILKQRPKDKQRFISCRYKSVTTEDCCVLGALSPKLQELPEEFQECNINEIYIHKDLDQETKSAIFEPLFAVGLDLQKLCRIQAKNDFCNVSSLEQRFQVVTDYIFNYFDIDI